MGTLKIILLSFLLLSNYPAFANLIEPEFSLVNQDSLKENRFDEKVFLYELGGVPGIYSIHSFQVELKLKNSPARMKLGLISLVSRGKVTEQYYGVPIGISPVIGKKNFRFDFNFAYVPFFRFRSEFEFKHYGIAELGLRFESIKSGIIMRASIGNLGIRIGVGLKL